ncbi:MAG: rod shape-determining protein RodA [Bacteroidota bacterium]
MNRKNFDFDLVTILLYVGLVLLGWMTIYAVSSANFGSDIFNFGVLHGKQLVWMGVSLVVAMLVLLLDHRFLNSTAYLAYGASIFMLVLVLFIGKEVNGAKSWLIIGGQQFQPSEFAKLATALALAKYMSRLNFSMNNGQDLIAVLGMIIVPALIVIFQNDTGSALVFGSFLIVLFREGLHPLVPIVLILLAGVALLSLYLGGSLWVIAGIFGLGLLVFVFTFSARRWIRNAIWISSICAVFSLVSFGTNQLMGLLQDHQQIRLKVLFDPSIDPQGAGYNVIQSKIAIGSGGVWGKGYLQGNYTKYQFVPKQETDFIYCAVGEEYGWIGSTVVLLCFFLLIWRLQFLSENSKTRFARIYGYSVVGILFFHVVINIGMTIGLVPVIGIPLPFFSYGGSSLLSFTVLIFVLINLYSSRIAVLGSKA